MTIPHVPVQAGGGVPGGDAGALLRGAADVMHCLIRLMVACLEETLAHHCAALLTSARAITEGS